MIKESYAECLVKRKTPGYAPAVRGGMILLLILSAASVLVLGLVGVVLFLALCLAARRVRDRLNLEYEYLYADRIFTVDCIFNRSKRKKAAEYPAEEILLIAPEQAEPLMRYEHQVKKITDYSSGYEGRPRYGMIVKRDGNLEKIWIEPNEELLKCLRMTGHLKFLG